ncbi:ATP-binding protein [Dyella humicola]|uniref:ATP-binding protein n=1 Tax=Dyella humicola TaxID=2992126 RepID=UPI00224F8070|nr:ATP-binding protein [Dyella humicola]
MTDAHQAAPLRHGIASEEAIAIPSEIPADPIERLLMRIRLRTQLRVLWLRTMWRRESEGSVQRVVSHAQVDAVLEEWDTREAEVAFRRSYPAARAAADALMRVELAIGEDKTSRLKVLINLFELTPREVDLLEACLAASLDPGLARVFAYLQDVACRTYVTEELTAKLFEHDRHAVLDADSALRRWQLVMEETVAPGEPPAIMCDPLIRAWVLGGHHLDEALVGIARPLPLADPLSHWPIETSVARIERVFAGRGRAQITVQGTPGSGRRTLAAVIASRLGLRLLAIDSDAIDEDNWPRVFARAQRQAFLDRCALAWTGERVAHRLWPRHVSPFPLQFVVVEPGQLSPSAVDAMDEVIVTAPLTLTEREALLHNLVPGVETWAEGSAATLASRHRLSIGEIAALGRQRPSGPDDATERVRNHQRNRLGNIAQWIECPFTRDDLVLPVTLREAVEDLVFEASVRMQVWEESAARRLFSQGRGLFALLAGPPGTGKTMTAQTIAATLGLDLFRISLSEVVSKYVGETSKNLQRVFARAEEMDAVLLFDEADALFSRRTEIKDAHDRYANTDTNHLLQAVETYGGLALLATNRKSNIDPAFLRRLRYVLDFPKPEAAERSELWRRLVGELAGSEAATRLTPALHRLAESIEVTGAQIKYAVLTAVFASRRDGEPVNVSHLLRGLERELIKDGRALSERDRERLRAP